jgi:hypothetical protein
MENKNNRSESIMTPTATQSPANDITQEEYKGTGRVVSAFGYSAVEGKIGALAGAAAGIAAGAVIGPPVIKFEKALRNGLVEGIKELGLNSGAIKIITEPVRIVLKFLATLMDWAAAAPKHLLESMPAKWRNAINSNIGARFESSMIGGEMGALTGFLFTLGDGAVRGVATSNAGEDQHKRAVEEIKTLRAENAKLRTAPPQLPAAKPDASWAEQTVKSREQAQQQTPENAI